MKKYLPIAVIVFVIVFLIDLAVFLSLLDTRRGLNRLEEDLVVVQDTQFQILQLVSTKSATPSVTPAKKVVSTASGDRK